MLLILLLILLIDLAGANPLRTRACITTYVEGPAPYDRESVHQCIETFHIFLSQDELEQLHYSYERLHDAARWVHGNKTYSSFTADELLHQNNHCAERMVQLSFSLNRLSDYAYHHGANDMLRTFSVPSQLHALASIDYMKSHIQELDTRLGLIRTQCSDTYDENVELFINETAGMEYASALRNAYISDVQGNITTLVQLEESRRMAFEMHNGVADVFCAPGYYCNMTQSIELDDIVNATLQVGTIIQGPAAIFSGTHCIESDQSVVVLQNTTGVALSCNATAETIVLVNNSYPCPPGTYNNKTMQTLEQACIPCPPGTFQNQSASLGCLTCVSETLFGSSHCS